MQVRKILENQLEKPGGLDLLIKMALEILMAEERHLHNAETGDSSNGYRPRRLFATGHVIELRVPRTRHHAFLPHVLGFLRSQRVEMERLAHLLYTQGSTLESISEVMALLYGPRYSTSQIDRLALSSRDAVAEWLARPLNPRYECVVIDATFIPTCRYDAVSREAYYVAMGLRPDGRREILGVYNSPAEGSGAWEAHFADLRARGVRDVGLVVSDALTGIEHAVWRAFPGAEVQLCAVHFMRQCEHLVKRSDRAEFLSDLRACFDTGSALGGPADGLARYAAARGKWGAKYPRLPAVDAPRTPLHFTFLAYDYTVRRYLYTTNWVESFNRKIKRATRYKNALPQPESAIYIIGSLAMRAEYLSRPIPALQRGLPRIGEVSSQGEEGES